jgi:hypothetical protein
VSSSLGLLKRILVNSRSNSSVTEDFFALMIGMDMGLWIEDRSDDGRGIGVD